MSTGMTVTQDFTLTEEAVAGEEVVVLGIRGKTQAVALTRQMNAANIVNIVASDQIGRFPDSNAPEALQRVPGVQIQRDMGEGRYVQMRGSSPAMTSLTINGERAPSAEGDVRQIALDFVSVAILEAIEVTKAITPDMDADAIGGSINLVTKRAPAEGMFSVEVAPGYGTLREKVSGKTSITWGDRLADGKLGVLVSGSLDKKFFGADDLEPEYDFKDTEVLTDDLLDELQVRSYNLSREHRGFTGVVDYRLNDNSLFYLNGTYNILFDDEIRRRRRLRVSKGFTAPPDVIDARIAELVAGGMDEGDAEDQADDEYNYLDNAAYGDTSFTGRLVYQHKARLEQLSIWNVTAGGEHLLGNDMELDYHVTLTQAGEETPRDTEIEFVQKKVDFYPDLDDRNAIRANPEAGWESGKFKFDNIEPANSITTNRDIVAALNLAMPYQFGNYLGKLKVGAKIRLKEKIQDVFETVYELNDAADDIIMGDGNGEAYSLEGYYPGDVYAYPEMVFTEDEVANFVEDHKSDLDFEYVHEDDAEDFEASETTIALYGMTELNISPELMILAGIRYEQTTLTNTGYGWVDGDDYGVGLTARDSEKNNFLTAIRRRGELRLHLPIAARSL